MTIKLDQILFFDHDDYNMQEKQEKLDTLTESFSDEQKKELESILIFVRDKTEHHYDK